jgi:Zn-dependent alcohol dehydrogenase
MTIIVVFALAVVFLLSGATKVVSHPISIVARDKLAVPPTSWSLLGAAEIAGAAGVLVGLHVKPIGIAAAIGLVLVGLGALRAHRRAHDALTETAPAVVAVILAAAALALFATGK